MKKLFIVLAMATIMPSCVNTEFDEVSMLYEEVKSRAVESNESDRRPC